MIERIALLLVPAVLAAQPAFEAASIKPADPQAVGFEKAGRFWTKPR